jgi:tetratricopeptide (TPR) repeat protein
MVEMLRVVVWALLAGLVLALGPETPLVMLGAAPQAQTQRDPDQLYAAREELSSALAAADAWAARLAENARDFEAAWKLARACYWLGGHVAASERRQQYERGVTAGRRAVELDPDRPEGHFWMAADMGALAESSGLLAGLRYRSAVKRELEVVLKIDAAYQQGSADRALGRWYLRVPGLFGGSKEKSVEHLQRSLDYDPDSAASHYFLAETYLEMDRPEDARRELQKVLDAPLHPDWVPEVREFKRKATALLGRVG